MNVRTLKTAFVILLLTNCVFTQAAEQAAQAQEPIIVQRLDLKKRSVVQEWKEFVTQKSTPAFGYNEFDTENVFVTLALGPHQAQVYGAKTVGMDFVTTAVGFLGIKTKASWYTDPSDKRIVHDACAEVELLAVDPTTHDQEKVCQILFDTFSYAKENQPVSDVWLKYNPKHTDKKIANSLEKIGFTEPKGYGPGYLKQSRILIPRKMKNLHAELQASQKKFDDASLELLDTSIKKVPEGVDLQGTPYRDAAFIDAKKLIYGSWVLDDALRVAQDGHTFDSTLQHFLLNRSKK